jgi:hypothetical protein
MSASSSKRQGNQEMGEEKEHYSDHFYGLPLSTYYTIRRVAGFVLFLGLCGFGMIWFINFFERNYEAIEINPLSLFSSNTAAEIKDWNLPPSETAETLTIPQTISGSTTVQQQNSPQDPAKLKTHKELAQERIQRHYEQLSHTRPELTLSPPASEKQLPYESLLTIIERWNPDDPNVPADFKERIQHFDYSKPEERAQAAAYRDAELPFKLYNVPEFNDVSFKWDDSYLNNNLNSIQGRVHVEKSKSNHFMFWAMRGFRSVPNFKPPTELTPMTFQEWLKLAQLADRHTLDANKTHFYFMTGADAHENGRTFISRDLSLFSTKKANFFITNPAANKGIQCRFGMRGVIAESHYDSGKNMITMLRGQKRYIVTPPRTCSKLGIIADVKHPSYRHSVIDWSDISQAKQAGFDQVDAIDTVVHMGEILYLPSFWFHYIVSLEYSIQCNSRSGFPKNMIGQKEIKECFRTP